VFGVLPRGLWLALALETLRVKRAHLLCKRDPNVELKLGSYLKDIANLTPMISGWWYTYPSEKYESQLG
jgi:hypothetical protein